VLVGFADALAAPEACASLLDAGHRVVSFSRRGRAVALRRMHGVEIVEVTPPETDLAACVAEVAAIARVHHVVMPLDDPAVLVCDRGLPVDAPVAGPRAVNARLALDKREQLRRAEEAGLEVPTWIELAADAELPSDWTLPAMLKPALAVQEHGGRLQRLSPGLLATPARLESVRRSWGATTPAILQHWVAGEGCGVFGLAEDGVAHHLSAHRRVRMMNPAGSGSSACVSTPVPDVVREPIARLLQAAGWTGMFMVELLKAGDTWWFMELNGRPWGSLALARRLGYEYPAWAVARLLDPAAALPEPPPFTELTCRNLGRELVHLMFVLRGSGPFPGTWPGRAETVRALCKSNGHTSWYNLGPGMRGVFLYDAWRTVLSNTAGRRS
jgi:hypothetical protein